MTSVQSPKTPKGLISPAIILGWKLGELGRFKKQYPASYKKNERHIQRVLKNHVKEKDDVKEDAARQMRRAVKAKARQQQAEQLITDTIVRAYIVNGTVPIMAIKMAVCNVANVSFNEIETRRRFKKYIRARHLIYWFCRRETTLSSTQIGIKLGGYDHSTVLNGIKKINQNYADYEEDIQAVEAEIVALMSEHSLPSPNIKYVQVDAKAFAKLPRQILKLLDSQSETNRRVVMSAFNSIDVEVGK